MYKAYHTIIALLILSLLSGCSPNPTITTSVTNTPPAPILTATPIPTNRPLPSEIPREALLQSLTPTPQSFAAVRFVHASNTIEAVDIYLDDQLTISRLQYGRASGEAEVISQTYQLRLLPATGRADSNPLFETSIDLNANTPLVAVIMPDPSGSVQVKIYEEDRSPLDVNTGRVSVINAQSDQTLLDLPEEQIEFGIQSQPFIYDSEESITDIPILTSIEFIPRSLYNYMMIIAGNQNAPTVIAVETRVSGKAQFRLANLSSEIGTVDIYINGESAFSAFDFHSVSDIDIIGASVHEIAIYTAGDNPDKVAPLLTDSFVTTQNRLTDLFIMGPASNLKLVSIEANDTPTEENETQITFVNGVSEVPFITEIRQHDDQPIVLNYAQSITRTYVAGNRDFVFVVNPDSEDTEVIDEFTEINYEAGESYLIMLTGKEGSPIIVQHTIGTRETRSETVSTSPVVHFVNATDLPLQIIVDGILTESNLIPMSANQTLLTFTPGQHEIVVADANTLNPLYTAQPLLAANERYSLVVYGDAAKDNYTLIEYPIKSTKTEGALASEIRLINVSLNLNRLGLAFAPANEDERPSNQSISESDSGFRIPATAQRFDTQATVSSGQATGLFLISEGTYDFYIYDANSGEGVTYVYGVTIEANQLYEMIVIPDGATTQFNAFVAKRPSD